jgi:2-polyprenyl-3-methyl-5-hydroxy-6-metoxy-1,4-benzoquinol methylase
MATSEANEERYSSPEYIATYLNAEWGDLLYPTDHSVLKSSVLWEGNSAAGGAGYFYRTTASLAHAWASEKRMERMRICDVGGGTGRMCFELAHQFPEAQELMLVEPSAQFCTWSRRLLLGDAEFDGWIPVPEGLEAPRYLQVRTADMPPIVSSVNIFNVLAEDTPRPAEYFDMITCLNVVDRVSDPRGMIETLGALLRPGGLLVLASPLHFEETFTERSAWVQDLKELLDQKDWRIDEREADVRYTFLHYRRRLNCYLSQVVGAEKIHYRR